MHVLYVVLLGLTLLLHSGQSLSRLALSAFSLARCSSSSRLRLSSLVSMPSSRDQYFAEH